MNNVAPTMRRSPRGLGVPASLMAVALGGVGLLATAPAFMGSAVAQRGLLAAVIMLILIVLMRMSPTVGINATFVYLIMMAWLRRALIPFVSWVEMDPLLLVAPGVAIVYGVSAIWRTRGQNVSRTTKHIFLILAMMLLEVFNPLQGGISVGVIGILFYVIPILWFFVGRDLMNAKRLSSFLQTITVMSVIVLAYGMYQMCFGFSDSEKQWALGTTFAWILAPGLQRPFSTMPSFAEYAHILMAGCILLTVGVLFKQKIGWVLIPLMLYGLFMESSRSAIMSVLAAMCVVWAVMGRDRKSWWTRGGIAVVVAVIALVGVMSRIHDSTANDASFQDSKTSKLVSRQTDGFLNPTDPTKSTLGIHSTMVVYGVTRGFETPIGFGLGATTMASVKMGNDNNNTEIDVSNIFTAMGFIGGFLYLAFLIRGYIMAFATWHKTRDPIWLGVIGLLVAYVGLWLIGGEYTTSMLIWLCLGALERFQRKAGA